MKLINLKDDMLPLTYLVRHWGRWYYVDTSGNLMKVSDVILKLKQIEES